MPPLHAEVETLKVPAPGGVVLKRKPAMDVVPVQQRPDQVSPCPRCQSLDTKFCYFNNHNVKQPRHFCRRCQRYWTAGGALRNVPVGAGRRKHKTSSISTASKFLHPEENHLSSAAAGMGNASNKTSHFLSTPHTDGAQPHSYKCVAAMSEHSGTDAPKKEGDLGSFRHRAGAFYGVQRGTRQIQHREENSSAHALLGSCNAKAENQVALSSTESSSPSHTCVDIEKTGLESSASTTSGADQKMGIANPLGWSEQLSKANHTSTSEFVQKSYGYASLSAWCPPSIWPWLMPYAAPTSGLAGNNMDQAAWVCAVMATAANILQTSPLWSPYGWGRDMNKSEKLPSLGKHGCSSVHEQEPLRVPKTLKIGDPDEVMHSSILTTLGVLNKSAASSASVAGFLNTSSQPIPAVRQNKLMVGMPAQHPHRELQRVHDNPAAQARSLVFQESS